MAKKKNKKEEKYILVDEFFECLYTNGLHTLEDVKKRASDIIHDSNMDCMYIARIEYEVKIPKVPAELRKLFE